MTVKQALALKPNQIVHCPADRGSPPFVGRVKHVGRDVQRNIRGVDYVWVTLHNRTQHDGGGVWPSNRLG